MTTTHSLLKGPQLWVLIFLSMIAISRASYAQGTYPDIGGAAYKAAIEDELTKYGGSRYLYDHADAYQRLVQFHALKKMGYDLTLPETQLQTIPESTLDDTTMDITSKNRGDQNETTIAISRANPQIIVAGANDLPNMVSGGMPVYYTTSSGKTWSVTHVQKLSSSYETLGDPAIVAGDSGYFYYAYLAGSSNQYEDNLVVATSKDGQHWTNGGYIVPQDSISGFEDKENICIDNNPSSPHYGRVYVVWVHFNGMLADGGAGKISWSDDRCKSWSTPQDFMDSIIMFSEVRVGSGGEVFLSFSLPPDQNEFGHHYFLVSRDGGNSFRRINFSDFSLYPPRASDYRPSLKGDAGFRAYPYIAHDVDLRTNQIHLVYGTWYNDNINLPAAALYYISSTDLGKTWTNPLAVGISNPEFNTLDHDRFCPWVSVNQKTGDAYCMYYSSERDSNNALISSYRAKLTGGMKEFPQPLEQSDFDPILLTKTQGVPFIGDYQGSDTYDSVYAASWTEGRGVGNDGDVFVFIESPHHQPGVTGGVPVVIQSAKIWLSAPSPNPARTELINFSYYLPHEAIAEIALYTEGGVKIKTFAQEKLETGTYSEKYSLAGLPSGAYILRLSTPYGSAEKNVVIMK